LQANLHFSIQTKESFMMKTILISILISSFMTATVQARPDISSGPIFNEQDAVAAEFAKMAQKKAINRFTERAFTQEFRPIVHKLKEVLPKTQIRSEENLKLNGEEVDAVNIPAESLIIVNRNTWPDLRKKERIQLVLHEFLWIAGYDDSSYQYSAEIQRQLSAPPPGIFCCFF
jgi:hypothetical protein